MFESVVLKPMDFSKALDQGLDLSIFKYRILAEGDSWMERSAVFQGSLPEYFARLMDSRNEFVLIINLAMFGDELRRIGESVNGEFKRWINDWTYDAVFFSAGGNDYIDAARDPDPGKGILYDLRGKKMPDQGHDCVNWSAVDLLRQQYLSPNFELIYNAVQNSRDSKNKDVPILLNSYDIPVARNAPAIPRSQPWLYAAYTKNGIDKALWPDVTSSIFDSLDEEIDSWSGSRPTVFRVPTLHTLNPADAGSTGSSGDWINEIHPNAAGWKKLAPIWLATLATALSPVKSSVA